MLITRLSLFRREAHLCALAAENPVADSARGLLGSAVGGIMPVVQTVISDVVTPREARPVIRLNFIGDDGAGKSAGLS